MHAPRYKQNGYGGCNEMRSGERLPIVASDSLSHLRYYYRRRFFVCERQHGIPISVPDIWPPRKEISVKNKAIVAKTHRERKKSWQKIGDGGRPIEEETSPFSPKNLI